MVDGAKIAAELASGGAYTAWFIVVALATVVVYLYKEAKKAHDQLIEAYKEEDGQVLTNTTSIIRTQMETTATLSAILRIIDGR